MACNCAQGYNQPFVNRTPCGCQQGYSGPRPYGSGLGRPYGMAYALGGPPMPLMGRLMGAIPQQMAPIAPGGSFAFGFQESTVRWPFLDETSWAKYLEDAGLSYNTTSGVLTGHLNPYVTITGNAKVYYDSATQFAYDILNVLQQNNVPIDTSSINFQAEPFDPNATGPLPMVGLQATPGGSGDQQQSSSCPPGYYDASVFHGLLGVNCQPIGSQPQGFSWSALFGAGGSGVALGVVAVVAVLLISKR